MAETLAVAIRIKTVKKGRLASGQVKELTFSRHRMPSPSEDWPSLLRRPVRVVGNNTSNGDADHAIEFLAGEPTGAGAGASQLLVELTRNVTVAEYPWLLEDYEPGKKLRPFDGPTYGVISSQGAATQELDDCNAPFFEIPRSAIRWGWSDDTRATPCPLHPFRQLMEAAGAEEPIGGRGVLGVTFVDSISPRVSNSSSLPHSADSPFRSLSRWLSSLISPFVSRYLW